MLPILRNKKFYYFFIIIIFSLALTQQAQAKCTAKVSVLLKDYEAKPLTNVRFHIYEQVRFGNSIVPGKKLMTGTTDEYLGTKEVEFELIPGQNNYALMVENPNLKNADFWYFDGVHVTCNSTITIKKRLDSLRVRVKNTQGELQKNIVFNLYSQELDANNNPVVKKSLGNFNTGTTGQDIVYLPSQENSLNNTQYYALVFKGPTGGTYYKYNIEAVPGVVSNLNYTFSDLKIIAQDSVTEDPIPNFVFEVYEQKENNQLGKKLTKIKTNNNGIGYLQYPPGRYILQYQEVNRSKKNFYNILINEGKQTSFYINVDRENTGKCSIKSKLNVSFRDWNGNIATGLNFILYQQSYNNDGKPIPGKRLTRSSVDENGLGQITFYPLPSERYVLKVCYKNNKYGCFYYYNLHFSCNSKLFFEKNINSVNIVLRNTKGDLIPGQSFKIYKKEVDVDGKLVVNKNKLVNSFKLPVSGKMIIYLSPKDELQQNQEYIVSIPARGNIKLIASFKILEGDITNLEYKIKSNKLIRISKKNKIDLSLAKRLSGRILLQVEGRGEAWYVNPINLKRYYLGNAEDTLTVVRRLVIGISDNDLNKIKLNLDIINGKDNDHDGLPNDLEKSIGSNPNLVDTDQDGYPDLTEARFGYKLNGRGRLPISKVFAKRQRGKFFLQVQGVGEIWYINPLNSQRYFLNNQKAVTAIIQKLGLGISNSNLHKIPVGTL